MHVANATNTSVFSNVEGKIHIRSIEELIWYLSWHLIDVTNVDI